MASASGSGEPPKKMMKFSDKDEEVNKSTEDVKKEAEDNASEVKMLRYQLMELKKDNTWSVGILKQTFYKLRDSVEALGGKSIEGPQDTTIKSLVFKIDAAADEILKKVPMPKHSDDDDSGCSGSDSGDDVTGSDDHDNVSGSNDDTAV